MESTLDQISQATRKNEVIGDANLQNQTYPVSILCAILSDI